MVRRRSSSNYGGVPADLARKGDCGAAKRALGAMRPGLAQDYEAGRVEELCAIGTRGADLDTSRGYRGYIVRSAEKPAKSSWTTKIVEAKDEAIEEATRLSRSKKKPVCVFASKKWEATPICFENGKKVPYRQTAPTPPGTLTPRGAKMKRLALDRDKMPIVALDGLKNQYRKMKDEGPAGLWNKIGPGEYEATDASGHRWVIRKAWARLGGESWRVFASGLPPTGRRVSSLAAGKRIVTRLISRGDSRFGSTHYRPCKPFTVAAFAKGARIEHREHPEFAKSTAKKIARDHLCKNPNAYKKER